MIYITSTLLVAFCVQSTMSSLLRGAKPERRKLETSCTDYSLDFSRFVQGQYIDDSNLGAYGIHIEIQPGSSTCDSMGPIIFDTTGPACVGSNFGGDSLGGSDLSSMPSELDIMYGEDQDPIFITDVSQSSTSGQGNALIISDPLSPCSPDVCSSGGSFTFFFEDPVNLGPTSLSVLDTGYGIQVQVQYAGNAHFTPLAEPEFTGFGGLMDYPLQFEVNVLALKVIFKGPSAITGLSWTSCQRNPTVWGDPHFKTWAGTKFDYHGACDIKLLHSNQFGNGKGLEVQVRTTQIDYYSYISDIAIRIGDNVLEIAARNTHYLNGKKVKALSDLSGYPISHYFNKKRKSKAREWVYDIELNGPNERIHIRAFKDYLFFSLSPGVYSELADSVGLMGDWVYGDMLSRDGEVMDNVEQYSEEWQVRDFEQLLFRDARFPQFPQRCTPGVSISNSRRLAMSKISREEAEAACAHWGRDKDQCVFDVMATGDIEIAG